MKVIEVAAGLVYREGRYLIARRNPGVHLAGFWEFPGGKCEPGETLEECLRRELFEELGAYLEMSAAEKMKQGMSRKDALRAVVDNSLSELTDGSLAPGATAGCHCWLVQPGATAGLSSSANAGGA